MVSTAFANLNAPGVYLTETTAGYRVLQLASFQTVYMVGSATTGDFNTPTQVRSLAEFTNIFGASPSEAAVRLFFRNDRSGVLFFVRTQIAQRFVITSTATGAGARTVVINGTNVTYTGVSGDDEIEAADGLLAAINASSVANVVTATSKDADEIYVRADVPGTTFTLTTSTGSTLTVAAATPTSPIAADYIYSIENTFDYEEEWAQGFLIAPEAFELLTVQGDRTAVASAMEQFCADKNFDWFAILDCGASIDTITELQNEAALYTSAQGHSAYYAPYLVDFEDVTVPASAAIAGIATTRFKQQGFQQPPAGASFGVKGCKDVAVPYNRQNQEVLNPLGINIIRKLSNIGIVVWAFRTRSSNSFYRFVQTRIIMNVLNGTLRRAFNFDLFNAIDGQGVLLSRIEETARAVCRRLWRGKALFGNSEAEAFEVVCNFENNQLDDLELGNVLVEVYVAPAPAVEKILINTIRVPIGQVQTSAEANRAVPVADSEADV
jgi:uncharacterized protein